MRNTLEKNGELVIKNTGTGDKECWNRWKMIRKRVREIGRTYQKSREMKCNTYTSHFPAYSLK